MLKNLKALNPCGLGSFVKVDKNFIMSIRSRFRYVELLDYHVDLGFKIGIC